MKIITVLNQKGGVAKSTCTHNIAAEMAARNLKVLVVDTDQQGTLSFFCGIDRESLNPEQTTLAALLPEKFPAGTIGNIAVTTGWGGDIWPANDDLMLASSELLRGDAHGPNQRMSRALREWATGYDIVLLDSPPALSLLTINNLAASDYVLIPVPGFTAIDGLSKLLHTIEQVREYENPQLKILGVLNTMKRKTKHASETEEIIEENLPGAALKTSIPFMTQLENSQPHQMPIREYAPGGKVAAAYSALADELLQRLEMTASTTEPQGFKEAA
jgi:chromosome partitioning protein